MVPILTSTRDFIKASHSCSFSDSTLEDILAVARTRPESVEAGVVQCDDGDDDSSSSDEVSSSGGSDQNDPPPPVTAAPVLAEATGTGIELDPFGGPVPAAAAATTAVPSQSAQVESGEEESSEDNDNGFTFVKEPEKVRRSTPREMAFLQLRST